MHRMPPVARHGSSLLATARSHDVKPSKREQILGALNRINEKSTQKVAADELRAIISELDADYTAVMVAALCNTTGEHKPFARKECLVALTQMVSAECPMQSAVMGAPHFNKILGHIKKMMQDSESIVRDACATFLESAMAYLATASESLLPGSLSHPVIKLIFDVMNEQKKEAQCGAASALRAVAPFIGPLDKDTVKDILRMMRNNAFQATHLLLNAIASPSPKTMQIHGLLATGADAFLPNLSKVLGPAPQGSGSGVVASSSNGSGGNSTSVPAGILPCLQRADWQVRKAAADCLNAMALLLGTHMEPAGIWERYHPESLTGRCLAALDTVKFDRVKLVRDAVQDAIATLQELQSHAASGGSMEAWRQMVDVASPLHKAAQPPSPTGSDKHRASSAGAVRQSSLHERFVRAHTGGEVLLEAPSKQRPLSAVAPPLRRSSKSDAGDDSTSRRAPVRMSAPVLQQNRRNTKELLITSHEASESAEVLEVGASMEGSVASVDQVNNSVNASRASDLPEAASPPREAVPQLQAEASSSGRDDYVQVPVAQWEETLSRLQALEDLVPALVRKVAGMPALEERVASLEGLGEAVAGMRAWQDGHGQQHFQEQDSSASFQDKLAERVSILEAQAAAAAAAAAAASSSPPQSYQPPRPPSLTTSIDAGLQSLGFTNGEPLSSASPSPTLPQRTPSRYRMSLNSPAGLHQSSEEPMVLAEGDLDNMFGEAVKGKEVDLLRLMGRTQPAIVWGHLSPDTAMSLLDSVAGLLERGVRPSMMLQWLWRVADEEQELPCDVPLVLRMRVVNAIASMPQSDDAWGTEKGALLLGTLLQVWELPDPIAAGSVQRRSSSSRRINSYELRSASASPAPVIR